MTVEVSNEWPVIPGHAECLLQKKLHPILLLLAEESFPVTEIYNARLVLVKKECVKKN